MAPSRTSSWLTYFLLQRWWMPQAQSVNCENAPAGVVSIEPLHVTFIVLGERGARGTEASFCARNLGSERLISSASMPVIAAG